MRQAALTSGESTRYLRDLIEKVHGEMVAD
jgi:hypothetical protein